MSARQPCGLRSRRGRPSSAAQGVAGAARSIDRVPPRSPLPARHGLSAAWLRTPDRDRSRTDEWPTMGDWLRDRLPEHVDVADMLAAGALRRRGRPRGARPRTPSPRTGSCGSTATCATSPRSRRRSTWCIATSASWSSTSRRSCPRSRAGGTCMQSVVVRLRAELGLPELSPLHRLDRVTSGLLMLATEPRWRGPYQTLFEHRAVDKTYWALAPLREDLTLPVVVRNHIRKERGSWQARGGAGRAGQRRDARRARVAGGRPRGLPPDAAHGPHPPAPRAPARARHPDRRRPAVPARCATSRSTTSADRCSCSPGRSRSPTPSTAARDGSAASGASR